MSTQLAQSRVNEWVQSNGEKLSMHTRWSNKATLPVCGSADVQLLLKNSLFTCKVIIQGGAWSYTEHQQSKGDWLGSEVKVGLRLRAGTRDPSDIIHQTSQPSDSWSMSRRTHHQMSTITVCSNYSIYTQQVRQQTFWSRWFLCVEQTCNFVPRCCHRANFTKYNTAFDSAPLAPLYENTTASTKSTQCIALLPEEMRALATEI